MPCAALHALYQYMPACMGTAADAPATPVTHAAHALQLRVHIAQAPGTLRCIVAVWPNVQVLVRQPQHGAACERLLDLAGQPPQLGGILRHGGHCSEWPVGKPV